MNIGILTFHRADNYGAVLQNYGLKTALERLGAKVDTIDYRCVSIEDNYKVSLLPHLYKNPIKLINSFITNAINYSSSKKHHQEFEAFRKKLNLSRTYTDADSDTIQKNYDILVCGSDQVWNHNITGEIASQVYDLAVANDCPKASYAASSGSISNVTPKLLSDIKSLNVISVRESSLAKYLSQHGFSDVHVVCDPVFLLSKDNWRKISEPSSKVDRFPYLFLYYIDSHATETIELARRLSQEKGLRIHCPVRHTPRSMCLVPNDYNYSPVDFISCVANAEQVVASSFHAVAFSIIFEKQFVVILHEQTGSRVRDLLAKLGLESRIVTDFEDYESRKKQLERPIDYESVNASIAQWRDQSLEVLTNISKLAV